jgi:hypothetical protein
MENRIDIKDNIVGLAPLNIIKIGIIEARENFILAYETYAQDMERGIQPQLSYMIGRLKTWFMKLQAGLKRRLKDYDYLYLKEMIMDNPNLSLDEILDVYYILNEEMDAMGLTKIDTKEKINRSLVEQANRSHGL